MTHTTDDSPWQATAAYLYTLALPPAALAWEYLRRNARYQEDWCAGRASDAVGPLWGLHRPREP